MPNSDPNASQASIRQQLLVPLGFVTLISLVTITIIGISVVLSIRNASGAIDRTINTAVHAKSAAASIASAQAYANEVLSMTKMHTNKDVQQQFHAHLKASWEQIELLRNTGKDDGISAEIHELTRQYKTWIDQAYVLLGLEDSADIPTLLALNESAAKVGAQAERVVRVSQMQSKGVSEAAASSVATTIVVSGILATLMFLLVGWYALSKAAGVSRNMLIISKALRSLSEREDAETASVVPKSETAQMFHALKILEKSVTEKAKMTHTLEKQKDLAEEAVNIKSRFLANMSHEIRTPINGVMGMAEILTTTDLDEDQLECAQTILNSSEALLTVINDILDFSKNEAGELSLVSEPFSLNELFYDIAALLGPPIGGEKVELCIDYPPEVPSWVIGDPVRVRQVLMNVIGNGVKFTELGSVSIRAQYDPTQDTSLKIVVQDTGIGIAEDKLDSIFSAFQQADMQTSRKFEGTGLGLAISQQLVQSMGGQITVASEIGVGTAFTIHLPLPTTAAPETTQTQQGTQPESLSGKRAIVVDDNDLNRRILQRMLESWGVEALFFISAEHLLDAVSKEKTLFDTIDIAIFDFNMPGRNGTDLLLALRKEIAPLKCPFILYSSSKQTSNEPDLQKAAFSSLLLKPARQHVLAQHIQKAMHPTQTPVVRAAPKVEVQDFGSLKILIAEDNKTNQLLLRKLLKIDGLTLDFQGDGQAAVDRFKTFDPDLVLMDLSMPVMDGLTATKAIRDWEQANGGQTCPIIALTANAQSSDRDACLASGMDDFLTKPIRKNDLFDALHRWEQAARSERDKVVGS